MLRPRLVSDEKGNEGLDRLLDGFWLVPIGFDYECKLGIANRHDVYVSSRVSLSQSSVFICNLTIYLGSRDPLVSSRRVHPIQFGDMKKRCIISSMISELRTKPFGLPYGCVE